MTVPPGMPAREIDKFLTRHEGWIETRIAKMPDQPKVRPGVKIPIRGVPHLIVHEPAKRGTVRQENGAEGPRLIVYGDRPHLARRVGDFLKREARRDLETLVARHTVSGRAARQGHSPQGYEEPLGVLHIGWHAVVFLAHHDGSPADHRLSCRT